MQLSTICTWRHAEERPLNRTPFVRQPSRRSILLTSTK